MLSEAELSEMLDIRRKIDALQSRFNELAAKMAAPPGSAAAAPAAPTPVAPAPAAPVAPAPAPAAAPVAKPVMAQPVMAQPAAARPVQPAAASVQPVRPAVPASQLPPGELETKRIPAAPPRPTVPPKDPANMTLKDHVVDVVTKAGKPLTFEDVYKRLEEKKAPLPADKPKLVVRQMLYNKALFQVVHGAFAIASDSAAASAAVAPGVKNVVGKVSPGDLLKSRLDTLHGKDKK